MAARPSLAAAGRLVVKVGSSSLTTPAGALDPERLGRLVDVLAAHRLAGHDVVLVSSGAIAAGIAPLGLTRRPRDLATQQAAATVGQGGLLREYAERFGAYGLHVGQVLLTPHDLVRRTHYRNAQRTLERLLELGVFPVVNENDAVATDEIRFGDNDRLAALVAHLLRADALVLLSDVDALYDDRPDKPGARRVVEVPTEADLAHVRLGPSSGGSAGRGGMIAKVAAARIATAGGVPVVLAAADDAAAVLADADVGTYFHPAGTRTPSRLLWLAHATAGRGQLRLDAGAVRAVVGRRASLLAAGVVGVEGTFTAGEPVDLVDENGHTVARGLVNFDSAEIPRLLGRSTRDLARELGSDYQREVVHRDDLVLVPPGQRGGPSR
jgi:glutamate 5-kinase